MKRNLTIIGLFILVVAGAYFYLAKENNPFVRDTSVYRAVPVSAPFFFELSSVRGIPAENKFVQELKNAQIGNEWFAFLNQADSLIEVTDGLPRNLRNTPFLLAYGIAGRNQLVPLIVTKAESNSRQNALKQFIQTLYPPGKYHYATREYGKHQIHEITDRANREILFYSFADDLLLASSRAIIIEQVIRQLSTQGMLKNPYFLSVNKSAGNQDISFYVNHTWINSFFAGILNRTSVEEVDEFGAVSRFNYASKAEKFRDFAAWSELGFQFNENYLLLTGSSAADDSLNHFLSVFDDQQPVRTRTDEVLPGNTSFFCSFSLSAKNAFFERLEEFYMHSPAYYHREERMKHFDRGFRASTRNVFQKLVKDEVIVAATTIPVNPANKTTYFILQTENRSDAEEQLKNLLANYAARNKLQLQDLSSEFEAGNTTRYHVYQFPYPSFPGLWLGSPFALAEAKFAAFYDDWLVFSNTEQGIHDYLRDRMNGTVLAHDSRYQQFIQHKQGRATINVFADVNKTFSLRHEIFATAFAKQIDAREENIRRFGRVCWQVQHEKGFYKNYLVIDYQEDLEGGAQTTWQSEIGNNITTKPQIVVNHNDPSNREIIFQDAQNNLHLIAHTGQKRWTAPLSGPVMGEIKQVDYYKNGKLQYLFNTKEKLYLIDRNGNNVAHFPVTLKSPATNGVNVFDYHNNRDYRYFVAGEDKRIYAYDAAGEIVTGWEFDRTQSAVTTPVQHFRVSGKDYIVFKDKTNIYIQDRQGETRVPVNNRFNNSNNPLVFSSVGAPKIVATEATGKVFYIYFDGKVEEKESARLSENHFFTVADLDGNDIADFIFVDGNEMTVMDENGKKRYSKKLDNPVNHAPNIYTFAAGLKKVGIADATSNRIYLFNPDGKLHAGFPLQGNTEFTIGKLSESNTGLNLIVGSEGGKLYNYTIN